MKRRKNFKEENILIIKQVTSFKQEYEKPKAYIIQITSVDIMETSGKKDDNEGEWDFEEVRLKNGIDII